MVYAFDFDGTMDDYKIHSLIKKISKEQNEIWVVTMRSKDKFNIDKMTPVLNKLGLTVYNVIFCDGKPKTEYLQGINADIYIDNITDEFEIIKETTNTIPLLWS